MTVHTFHLPLLPTSTEYSGTPPNIWSDWQPVRFAIWHLCTIRAGITYGEVLRELRLLYWEFPAHIARKRLRRQIKEMIAAGMLKKENAPTL